MLTAHPEINVIWACNDGGTIGAAMAVQQAGLAGKVFVFGYDGGDQQTSMILSGTISWSVLFRRIPMHRVIRLSIPGPHSARQDQSRCRQDHRCPGHVSQLHDPAGVNEWRKANGLAEITTGEAAAQNSTHHRRCGFPGRSVHEEHGPGL